MEICCNVNDSFKGNLGEFQFCLDEARLLPAIN